MSTLKFAQKGAPTAPNAWLRRKATTVELHSRSEGRREAARRRATTGQSVLEPPPALIATNFIGEHEFAKEIDRDIRTVRRGGSCCPVSPSLCRLTPMLNGSE